MGAGRAGHRREHVVADAQLDRAHDDRALVLPAQRRLVHPGTAGQRAAHPGELGAVGTRGGAGGSGSAGGAGIAGTSGAASSMRPRTSCGGMLRFGSPLLSRAGGRGAAGRGAGARPGSGRGAGAGLGAGAGAAVDGEGSAAGGEGGAASFCGRSRGLRGWGGGCQEGTSASGAAPTEAGSGRSGAGWAQPARQKAARMAKMTVRCIENPPELKSATPRSLAADCESRSPTFV